VKKPFPNAKLAEHEVRIIRRLRAAGSTQATVARLFHVHVQTIANIDARRTWANLD
jgi:DNA invertase Pin-like site-specific DNA recombinase